MLEIVRCIFLFPLVARCLETLDVCKWCMFSSRSVVGTVWTGSVEFFFCVARLVKDIDYSLGVVKYVVGVYTGVMDVMFMFKL